MAITDSLDAATVALNALIAQIKLSTCRTVQGQDTGTADNYVVAPLPAVTAYGPDLIVVVDIANPNTTTTPKISVSGLGQVTITTATGSAVTVGAVAGKCLIGFSSVTNGGFVARLIGASLSAAQIQATPNPNNSQTSASTNAGLSLNNVAQPINVNVSTLVALQGINVPAAVGTVANGVFTVALAGWYDIDVSGAVTMNSATPGDFAKFNLNVVITPASGASAFGPGVTDGDAFNGQFASAGMTFHQTQNLLVGDKVALYAKGTNLNADGTSVQVAGFTSMVLSFRNK